MGVSCLFFLIIQYKIILQRKSLFFETPCICIWYIVYGYMQAPTLYDDREPIDIKISEIGFATARPMAAAWEAKI